MEKRLEKRLKKDFDQRLDKKLEYMFNSKLGKLRDDMEKWRNDFQIMIDPILKEVQTARQEREVVAYRLRDHHQRIDTLETKVFRQSQPA